MRKRVKVFRPYLDDVENLSYGRGANRQRGTGSRFVCHRLNRDERKLYDMAKQANYLTIKGTGFRKERKGSPVCNTFRQRCDALEELCIIVEKRSQQDTVLIDFSTLRVMNDKPYVSIIVKNVLQSKYPDFYKDWMNTITDNRNENFDVKNSDEDVLPIVFDTPIHWEDVKSKPIWCIDERLIVIQCDRDVAKLLANDILKESANFDSYYYDMDDDEIIETTLPTETCKEESKVTKSLSTTTNNDESYGIDWNDI